MSVLGRKQLCVLGAVLGALSCGGDGGTTPPGPPVDLLKAGDNQSWYFNNPLPTALSVTAVDRSEEHTSELQSRSDLVCRLLLEKKNLFAAYRMHQDHNFRARLACEAYTR